MTTRTRQAHAGAEEEKRPRTGVSIAVMDGSKVLLVKRGKAPFLHFWSLPGGSHEWGETLSQAACREVREETGLAIANPVFVSVFEPMGQLTQNETADFHDADCSSTAADIAYHFVLALFAAESPRPEQAIAGDDALALRWVDLSQIEDLIANKELLATPDLAQRVMEAAKKLNSSKLRHG